MSPEIDIGDTTLSFSKSGDFFSATDLLHIQSKKLQYEILNDNILDIIKNKK